MPSLSQILLDTAQKRAALGEVEARHMEIMHLEANIMVRELLRPYVDLINKSN